MAGKPIFTPGAAVPVTGCITTNTWVAARSARALETSLGYGRGRLDAGWSVLVLVEKLAPQDFEFWGATMQSGGRWGLPGATTEADGQRPSVHADIKQRYGDEHYAKWRKAEADKMPLTGGNRLVKVVPVTGHVEGASPKEWYPMGGGGLQWRVTSAKMFVVAMFVNADQIAAIPGWSAYLGESAMYDHRARLNRHIETVTRPG
jgi:hypothetical protein